MKVANPYLMFDGDTERAFGFYKTVFGVDFYGVVRYGDFGESMKVAEKDRDKIAHIAMPLGKGNSNMLMASDTLSSSPHSRGNNFYIMLSTESAEEAHNLMQGLSNGGEVEMDLQRTEWAELYGMCTDKFGIQWMVNFEGDVQFKLG